MTDFIAAIPQWASSLLFGGGAGAVVSFLFHQVVKSAFDRKLERVKSGLEKEVVQFKSGLDKDLENHKTGLEKDVERFKDQLSRETQLDVERLRHEMAQEMVRTQLTTAKMHEAYPKVMQAVRRAEGAVLSPAVTGTGYLPVYEGLGATEIRKVLEGLRLPEQDLRSAMELFQVDKRSGVKEVERLVRKRSIADARHKLEQERNHLVLEGIFLSKAVQNLASQVFRTLSDALLDIEQAFEHPRSGLVVSIITIEKKLSAEIAELAERMQEDLRLQPSPGAGNPPTPPAAP